MGASSDDELTAAPSPQGEKSTASQGFRRERLFASAGQAVTHNGDIPTAGRSLADHAIDVPASKLSEGERGCSLADQ
jgi:hypothetical protein